MPVPDIPEQFNAVEAFIDKHLAAGHGDHIALRWNDQTIPYAQLAAEDDLVPCHLTSLRRTPARLKAPLEQRRSVVVSCFVASCHPPLPCLLSDMR